MKLLFLTAIFVVVANHAIYCQTDSASKLKEDSPKFVFGRDEKTLRRTAEENIRKPSTGGDRDLDLRLPHLWPIEKWFNGFEVELKNHPGLKSFVKLALRFIGRTSTDPQLVNDARKQGKYQEIIPDSTPFPCDTQNGRSTTRPTDVDHLRPGDVDVIAALGDSLTAGNGLGGSSFRHSMLTNRGMSALAGGQSTWRKYWTLPNIIKEFNPNLTGYSTGDTLYYELYHNQQLNLAEAGAVMSDLPVMAQTLHKKMSRSPKIDMQNDWKVVSIFMGGVDFCLDLCFWKRPQDGIESAERAIRTTLDYLMENFPRTVVLFMVYLDIGELVNSLKYEGTCLMHLGPPCPCLFGKSFQSVQEEYLRLIRKILDVQTQVARDPKYRSKPDFRVSVFEEARKHGASVTPTYVNKNGKVLTDTRFVSSDCFHLSQRGHAALTVGMWNALLQPRNQTYKPDALDLKLLCPTKESPYFFT